MVRVLCAALLVVNAAAWAQRSSAPPGNGVHGHAEVTFDPELVDGNLSQPDVEYTNGRPRAQHDRLIRVRESLRDKVMASVAEL